MQKGVVLLLVLLIIPLGLAAPVEITAVDHGSVVIKELNNPAKFTLNLRNFGATDAFEIYSLVGVNMYPKGNFLLESGKTTQVDIEAVPSQDIRDAYSGYFIFDYEIQSPKNGITKDTLRIKIVNLGDVLSITSPGVKPGDQNAMIIIKNLENTYLEDVPLKFESDFFEGSAVINLGPFEETNVTVPITSTKLAKAEAGTYPLITTASFGDKRIKLAGDLKYLEKGSLAVSESTDGALVRTTTYQKVNEGNIPIVAEIVDTKSLISRLFTTHNPRPQTSENSGFVVRYVWRQELAPGNALVVTSKTNYTVPFVLLLIIIAVLFVVKFVGLRPVMVRKQVSAVKTKGGELALRVRVSVKARSHVDNLQVIERVPTVMKLYDKFGIKPDKFDHATRRIIWNLPQLNAGEERVYSYILYSSVKLVGKVQLPSTTVIFEKGGATHEVVSNTAFLASEFSNKE